MLSNGGRPSLAAAVKIRNYHRPNLNSSSVLPRKDYDIQTISMCADGYHCLDLLSRRRVRRNQLDLRTRGLLTAYLPSLRHGLAPK